MIDGMDIELIADIVIFDDNIDISLTMVNGNVVFEE